MVISCKTLMLRIKKSKIYIVFMKTREHRFFEKVDQAKECWEWTASTTFFGYGLFYNGKKIIHAHRFSYELHFGEIKNGCVIMHICDNPKCVNPDHLKEGSQKDNVHDMIIKNRAKFGLKRKTINKRIYCINGHDVTDFKSLYVSKKGYTGCKICRKNQSRNFEKKERIQKWQNLKQNL